jgi:hypothetical protein
MKFCFTVVGLDAIFPLSDFTVVMGLNGHCPMYGLIVGGLYDFMIDISAQP